MSLVRGFLKGGAKVGLKSGAKGAAILSERAAASEAKLVAQADKQIARIEQQMANYEKQAVKNVPKHAERSAMKDGAKKTSGRCRVLCEQD